MSDLSLYFGNKIVRWIGGEAMPTAPGDIFIALFNGNPKSGGTEVTTSIRPTGRVAAVWDVPASGTGNVLATNTDTDFGLADSGATVSYVGAFDAASSGNLLASKALGTPQTIVPGAAVKFKAGDIFFTIGSAT